MAKQRYSLMLSLGCMLIMFSATAMEKPSESTGGFFSSWMPNWRNLFSAFSSEESSKAMQGLLLRKSLSEVKSNGRDVLVNPATNTCLFPIGEKSYIDLSSGKVCHNIGSRMATNFSGSTYMKYERRHFSEFKS